MYELEIVLEANRIDILCLNEHWLFVDELMFHVPNNFHLISSYCRTNMLHGGVAIHVRQNLSPLCKPIDVSSLCKEGIFECAAMFISEHRLIVVSAYSVHKAYLDHFIEGIEKLVHLTKKFKNNKIIVFADINHDVRDTSIKNSVFLNSLRSLNLYCHNYEPTRLSACLDNVISPLKPDQFVISVFEPHLSDHKGILFQIPVICNTSTPLTDDRISIRLLNDHTMNSFINDLNSCDLQNLIYSSERLENKFDTFLNTIVTTFNINCPKITKKRRNRAKNKDCFWYTPYLKNLKNLLLIAYEKSKTDTAYSNIYNLLKIKYRKEISLAKIQKNDSLISSAKNKCRTAWKIIKDNSGTKEHPSPILINPNVLNAGFINFGNYSTKEPSDTVHELVPNINTETPRFEWTPVQPQDILNIVKKLSNSKSEDYHGLSNFVIKKIIHTLLTPLCYFINTILEEGLFPSSLKTSIIVPIYKKGDRMKVDSYRPISKISSISKIIEGVIHNQLYKHFETYNLLNPAQYGFRNGSNTIKAVQDVVSFTLESFENKCNVEATLIDLSKAFDSVCHKRLINKLKSYNINGSELALINSYLSNRYQAVISNNKISDLLRVERGIPQGSVFSPFLFIIYMNDFPNSLPCKSVLYADDTTFLTSSNNSKDLQKMTASAMTASINWFNTNCLKLNTEKTEHLLFSTSKQNDNGPDSVKLLGINLDSKLTWEQHTNLLCNRLARVIFLLQKLRTCISHNYLLMTYHSLFYSHLNYGIILWGNSSGAKRVFTLQKRAVRAILGLNKFTSCKKYFIDLAILTVPCIFILHCLLHAKDNLTNCVTRDCIHSYNTRQKSHIDMPHVRLAKSQHHFSHISLKYFNMLPENVKSEPRKKFKTIIQEWLTTQAFYEVKEYEVSVHSLRLNCLP